MSDEKKTKISWVKIIKGVVEAIIIIVKLFRPDEKDD